MTFIEGQEKDNVVARAEQMSSLPFVVGLLLGPTSKPPTTNNYLPQDLHKEEDFLILLFITSCPFKIAPKTNNFPSIFLQSYRNGIFIFGSKLSKKLSFTFVIRTF